MLRISNNKQYAAIGLCLIIILVSAVMVYWKGLNGPFVLDDQVNVQNSYIESFDLDEVVYEVTHNTSGRLGRPVSVLSFIGSGLAHGPDTWGYKYHNLMLHLLIGLLIFWLFIRLLPHIDNRLKPGIITLIAGTTAACWLLHPLMVSTVLYVVQRMAQLSALFTVLALLVYVIGREAVGQRFIKYYGISFFLFPLCLLLAVFSKEDGALVVFYILAIEGIVFRLKVNNRKERTRVLIFLTVFSLVPILLGTVYLSMNLGELVNYALRDFNMGERVMTQLHVLMFYFKLILMPTVSDMSLYHDGWPVVRQMDAVTIMLLIFWCGVVALIFLCRNRAPIISFGLAWFLISHLLESTIFNLELVFEHRNYLAAVGLLLVVSYYLFTTKITILRTVPVLLLGLFVFMTNARVMEWQSENVLYSIAVRDHPQSYRANIAYANLQLRRGNKEEATKYLENAQSAKQNDYGAILHQLVLECMNPDSGAKFYNRAKPLVAQYGISIHAFYAFEKLGSLIVKDECPAVSVEQMEELLKTALSNEKTMRLQKYQGYLQRQLGGVYFHKGEISKGIDAFTSAYNNTRQVVILVELSNILLGMDQVDGAEGVLSMLEKIDEQRWGTEKIAVEELKAKIAIKKNELEGVGQQE